MSRSTFVIFLIIVTLLIFMNEIAFWWWRELNPGATWTGLNGKFGLQGWSDEQGTGIPNGYRPGGPYVTG